VCVARDPAVRLLPAFRPGTAAAALRAVAVLFAGARPPGAADGPPGFNAVRSARSALLFALPAIARSLPSP
jgi:hypothetical protein